MWDLYFEPMVNFGGGSIDDSFIWILEFSSDGIFNIELTRYFIFPHLTIIVLEVLHMYDSAPELMALIALF